MTYRIKEDSWVAAIAARKLKSSRMAIVIGSTIYLHNTSKEAFLRDPTWVKHELCHVRQFEEYGFFGFIFKYLYESYRNGYYNNKYEVAARAAEQD